MGLVISVLRVQKILSSSNNLKYQRMIEDPFMVEYFPSIFRTKIISHGTYRSGENLCSAMRKGSIYMMPVYL